MQSIQIDSTYYKLHVNFNFCLDNCLLYIQFCAINFILRNIYFDRTQIDEQAVFVKKQSLQNYILEAYI